MIQQVWKKAWLHKSTCYCEHLLNSCWLEVNDYHALLFRDTLKWPTHLDRFNYTEWYQEEKNRIIEFLTPNLIGPCQSHGHQCVTCWPEVLSIGPHMSHSKRSSCCVKHDYWILFGKARDTLLRPTALKLEASNSPKQRRDFLRITNSREGNKWVTSFH